LPLSFSLFPFLQKRAEGLTEKREKEDAARAAALRKEQEKERSLLARPSADLETKKT
jgi:hypothetical protein